MFRGLTKQEHLTGLCLVLALFSGLATNRILTRQAPATLHFQGAVAQGEGVLLSQGDEQEQSGLLGGQVDLNTADQALLETLPGIGPGKAQAILRWRAENGPFTTVDRLVDVPGFGERTLESLRPHLTVSLTTEEKVALALPLAAAPTRLAREAVPRTPAPLAPAGVPARRGSVPQSNGVIRLNTATLEQLMELDGVGEVLARRILEDRTRSGPYRSVEELERVKGVGPAILDRNRQRLAL